MDTLVRPLQSECRDLLQDAKEKLEAWGPKRLIEGQFMNDQGDRCVAGVLLPDSVAKPFVCEEAWIWIRASYGGYPHHLVSLNNNFKGTPEERYAFVLEQVRMELARREGASE